MSISRGNGRSASSVRMIDVARLAGVSLKSVSRVINGEPHVSSKLRVKVETAITELDFVPDVAARSLAGGRSFTIGVMLDNPSPHYTIKILQGAYASCAKQGYHLRIDEIKSAMSDNDVRKQLEAVCKHARVDGFILTPPLTDSPVTLDYLDEKNIEYVRVAPATDLERSSFVYIDDFAAAAEVAERLYDLGHRRYGLIVGPDSHVAALARRDGFLQRMRDLDPGVRIAAEQGGFSFEGGIVAARKLLGGTERPTAIFATNDDMAAGVLVACAENGLKVPSDVSLFGFDDSWIATSVWPSLTTVHQPIERMSAKAADVLLHNLREPGNRQAYRLDYAILERNSVAECIIEMRS